jgi:hypothetical protein
MSTTDASIFYAVFGACGTILGFVLAVWKLQKDLKKEKEIEKEEVLKASRAFALAKLDRLRLELEAKILFLEQEHKNAKDIYKSELSELSKRVEDLRDEVRKSNDRVIDLLHKALESRPPQ